jgi:hypothetical protein
VSTHPVEQSVATAAARLGEQAHAIVAKLATDRLLRLVTMNDEIALEVYHDRIREALLALIDDEERARSHRSLAQLLEVSEAVRFDVLARHLQGAGEPDRAAVCASVAADRAFSGLRFAEAAEFYGWALDWDASDSADRQRWIVRRASALSAAGRAAEAAPLFLSAASSASRDRAFELRRLAAEQLLVSGRLDEGRAILRPLFREIGLRYPDSTAAALVGALVRIALLAVRGTHLRAASVQGRARAALRADVGYSAVRGLIHVDNLRGGYLALQSLGISLRTGDPVRVARCLAVVGSSILPALGAWARPWGARMIEQAGRIAAEEHSFYLEGLIAISEGTMAMTADDWSTALECADRGVKILQTNCHGTHWECNFGRMLGLRALEELGHFRECAARSAEFLEEMRLLGDRYGALLGSQFRAHAEIAAGKVDEARSTLRDGLRGWSQEGFSIQHFYTLRNEVFADVYSGTSENAWERLAEAWPSLRKSYLLRSVVTALDAFVLRARTALAVLAEGPARRPELLRSLHSDLRWIESFGQGIAPAHAAALHGGLAALEGDSAAARARIDDALSGYELAKMRVYGACVRRAKGRILGGDEGSRMVLAAEEELRGSGVAEPAEWSRIYLPAL